MKKGPARFRILDVIIIILVAAVAFLSGFRIYGNRADSLHLVIEAPGGSWFYKLDTDRTISIPGALGSTTVAIAHGSARITDSPCPNKTCIAQPPISRKGDWNACLPNKVLIRIAGDDKKKDTVDIVGY